MKVLSLLAVSLPGADQIPIFLRETVGVKSLCDLLSISPSLSCSALTNLSAVFKIITLPLSLRADEWMSGAVDCLEFLPDELVVEVSRGLSGCTDDLPQCKRLLYEVLAQHYRHTQQPPLLSNHIFEIYSGISELLGKTWSHQTSLISCFMVMHEGRLQKCRRPCQLHHKSCFPRTHRLHSCIFCGVFTVNGKQEQALETLQLSLKLQDSRSREELRRLLRFMAIAAKPQEVKLHKEVRAFCAPHASHVYRLMYIWSSLTSNNSLSDWEQNGGEKVVLQCHRLQPKTLQRKGGPDGAVHDGPPLWSLQSECSWFVALPVCIPVCVSDHPIIQSL